ncbi:MAG: hypothetical protein K8R77_01675, partial [Anaerolineaceae bacterium]|nr:hypothetical protein [Anaerolineaceae bacterium]
MLRNYVFLYAIQNGLLLPLGTQGAELLDARINDQDEDIRDMAEWFDLGNGTENGEEESEDIDFADQQDLDIELTGRD